MTKKELINEIQELYELSEEDCFRYSARDLNGRIENLPSEPFEIEDDEEIPDPEPIDNGPVKEESEK